MKNKFLLSFIFVAGLMLQNFHGATAYGQTSEKKTAAVQTVKYTCPMHSQEILDKPGNCPICGMKLVVKKELSTGTMQQMNDTVMMKHDSTKMRRDSAVLKKGSMMPDTTMMDRKGMMNNTKMMHRGNMMPDTVMMKKGQMMHDTASMKLNRMKTK